MDKSTPHWLRNFIIRLRWKLLFSFLCYFLFPFTISACHPEDLGFPTTSGTPKGTLDLTQTKVSAIQTNRTGMESSYTETPKPPADHRETTPEISTDTPPPMQGTQTFLNPTPIPIIPFGGLWLFYSKPGTSHFFAVNTDGTHNLKITIPLHDERLFHYALGKTHLAITTILGQELSTKKLVIQNLTHPEKITEIQMLSYYDRFDPDSLKEDMQYLAASHCAGGLVWSPGYRYLAFTGAIEGPSADLYVYDTLLNELKWLTSGPDQAIDLHWSPDGQWIIHSAVDYCNGSGPRTSLGLWAAAIDGSQIIKLEGSSVQKTFLGWFDHSNFVTFDSEKPMAKYIRLIDYQTGEIKDWFKGWFEGIEWDPVHHFALIFLSGNDPDLQPTGYEPGIYLISNWVDSPILLFSIDRDGLASINMTWDRRYQRIIFPQDPFIECGEGEVNAMDIDGSIICAGRMDFLSPDGIWKVTTGPNAAIINMENGASKDLSLPNIEWGTWCSDSLCFFAVTRDERLYYIDVFGEQPKLIDDNVADPDWIEFMWTWLE